MRVGVFGATGQVGGVMVSGVLRTVKVPLEVGVTSWPPDGKGPEKRL